MDVLFDYLADTERVGDHPDLWIKCADHQGPSRLPAAPCAKCGRLTNATWQQCGHCAYKAGTCSGCDSPVPEGVLADSRAAHERRLGHPCPDL